VHTERVIADLEGGCECRLFASGMAAIASVFYTLKPGSHVVLPDSLYWGAQSWIERYCKRHDIIVNTFDTADADSIVVATDRENSTELVWLETPSNPMLQVTDIARAATHAHAVGAMLVVDSTAATPVFTRPLEFGADLVVHSATKALNGHSDLLAGAIVTADEHPLLLSICTRMRQLKRCSTRG